jgi:hypothetical protein
MRNLTPDDLKLLSQAGRQNPQLVELFARARADELELMAAGSTDHFPTQKGRVGMLTDILKLFKA